MASPIDDKSEKTRLDRLDRVRPTVVVRRRVYEPSPSSTRKVIHAGPPGPPGPPGASRAQGAADADIDEDEESGPPSSVNVVRALSSLRAHELKRLDALMSADDAREGGYPDARDAPVSRSPRSMRSSALVAAATPIAEPIVPRVRVGSAIPIADLARQMQMETQELVTSLVMRGFFSITVKSALPRETARTAATMFGFQLEEVEDEEPAPSKPKASAKSKSGKKAAPAPSRATAKPAAKKNTRPRSR